MKKSRLAILGLILLAPISLAYADETSHPVSSENSANVVSDSSDSLSSSEIKVLSDDKKDIDSDLSQETIDASDEATSSTTALPAIGARSLTRQAVETVAMYRLYNPNNKEHFYTSSFNEAKTLLQQGWGDYEGVGWYAPKSGQPVFRLYNPSLQDHHYTMSVNERDTLVARYGWKDEGIAWYSDDDQSIPIYRAFHPSLKSGSHNYTKDANEQNVLTTQRGWKNEGIAWYSSNILPKDNQDSTLQTIYAPYRWHTKNGNRYFTDANRQFVSGFQWIEGDIYYFNPSTKAMQKNTTVTDRGNTYKLNADGKLTSGNDKIEKAISSGMTKVGNSPYVLGGGRTPASIAANQFDCSSFTYWMYQQAGVSLGEQTATTTWTQQRVGSAVSFASMKRGDIFMMSNIGHVGLYLGGGYFIHSSPNAKFSTVYGGQAQPNYTYTSYSDYYGIYYGGVGVSRLTDVLSRDPADGNHPVTRTTWEQIQDNVVRRIVK